MYIFAGSYFIIIKLIMATYRELIYAVQDQVKNASDDAYYSDEFVLFLLNKYRLFLIKQEQEKKATGEISASSYQTICLDLEEVPAISGEPCEGGSYLKSIQKIPDISTLATPSIYPADYFQGNITYISRERFRYVGYNKWLQNIVYAAIGPDNYLYLKSSNPQFLYLEKARLTAIFEDPDKAAASELQCESDSEDNTACDPWESSFPMEEALIPTLLEIVTKTLLGAVYRPSDSTNNANDDMSDIMSFIRRNMKSNLQRQLEDE